MSVLLECQENCKINLNISKNTNSNPIEIIIITL
jgi:hypothetical protein